MKYHRQGALNHHIYFSLSEGWKSDIRVPYMVRFLIRALLLVMYPSLALVCTFIKGLRSPQRIAAQCYSSGMKRYVSILRAGSPPPRLQINRPGSPKHRQDGVPVRMRATPQATWDIWVPAGWEGKGSTELNGGVSGLF